MVVTFDANVLLSATLWETSVSHKLLVDLIKQNVKIYSSLAILNEYQNVLRRDFKFSGKEIGEIMEKVLVFTTIIKSSRKVDVVKEGPDDNAIIECALESKSKYILPYDPHLLNIKEYQGVKIIRPEIARAIF